MYACYRTVVKAQGWDGKRRENTRLNYIKHRGMQKDHIQITPDGRVIQHFKMNDSTIQIRKALTKAYEQAQAKQEANEVVKSVSE